jgi:adenylate kinase
MNLIILGPPGVGKGTIAKMIVKKYNFTQISAGDLIREEVQKGSKKGKLMKEKMEKGDLVPDDLVIDLVEEKLKKINKEKILLDGFPRTVYQAKKIESFITISYVLSLVASEETIIQRLTKRRICSKCGKIYHLIYFPPKKENICDICNGELIQRKDDTPNAIKERLKVHEKLVEPTIKYYKNKGIEKIIDASDNPEEILKRIEEAIF